MFVSVDWVFGNMAAVVTNLTNTINFCNQANINKAGIGKL